MRDGHTRIHTRKRRTLRIALKMHARVLASPRRGKSASEHETGADFSKFPARVARRAYPTNRPNDEPRDVPFKVSGIRLPKKTWTNGPAEISLSLSLSLSSSSSNVDAHEAFILVRREGSCSERRRSRYAGLELSASGRGKNRSPRGDSARSRGSRFGLWSRFAISYFIIPALAI